MHWLGAIPVEGVLGRLLVDGMTAVLNYPGTCVLVATLLLIAVLLSTAFSFGNLRQWLAVRFAFVYAWRDRWQNWKLRRAKKRAARAADRIIRAQQKSVCCTQRRQREPPAGCCAARTAHQLAEPRAASSAAAGRGRSARRASFGFCRNRGARLAGRCRIPRGAGARTLPVDADSPRHRTRSRARSAARTCDRAIERFAGKNPRLRTWTRRTDAGSISIGERADADAHPVTLTPRAVSGYRLPPSTLLHRSDDQQIIREDELREEAKVLVEKCAEFDVTGQVVQINPGPVVTTFEFRPEAGVKYSPRHRPGRRPLPRHARGEHPHRAHGRQKHGRHPGAELTTAKPSGCAM